MAGNPDILQTAPSRTTVRRIVGALCLTYVLSHYLRAAHAVIAPELVREFGLTAEQLAQLTAAFFVALAAAQIPVGLMIDRFGPRRTLYGLLLFAILGALLFPLAGGVTGLLIARACMGLGCAAMAMAAVVVFSRWVPADRFAAVSGLLFATGSAGSLLATTPLALASEAWGWRATYYLIAAAAALMGAVGFLVVRDAPPSHPVLVRASESAGDVLRGLGRVLRTPLLWRLSAVTLVNYPAAITVLALWGGPYLKDLHGLDAVGRGNVLFAMGVALVAGYLLYGQLDRLVRRRKHLILAGLLATAAPAAALAAWPAMPTWAAAGMFAWLGAASAFGPLLVAEVKAAFPDRLFGRAATVNNMALVTGSALLQLATGIVAGWFEQPGAPLPVEAYRAVFACIALAVLGAVLVYLPASSGSPASSGVPAED